MQIAASVALLLCGVAFAQSNRISEASAVFKAKPGFRTEEAEVLFPLVTNGMPRTHVVELLGQPQWTGPLASSSNRWTYSVFYSTFLIVHFEKDHVVKTEAVGFNGKKPGGQHPPAN